MKMVQLFIFGNLHLFCLKVFKENVYAHIMYNDTIYAIICIHIQMALLHQALHGFVLTNMYVLLVIVLRSHVEECLEG